jgi:hypothetical protein
MMNWMQAFMDPDIFVKLIKTLANKTDLRNDEYEETKIFLRSVLNSIPTVDSKSDFKNYMRRKTQIEEALRLLDEDWTGDNAMLETKIKESDKYPDMKIDLEIMVREADAEVGALTAVAQTSEAQGESTMHVIPTAPHAVTSQQQQSGPPPQSVRNR